MALFFFVAGLEIKRELVRRRPAHAAPAALPIVARSAAWSCRRCVFVALNAGGRRVRGWGIPMATDIAFAVGVLALVGRRAPPSLRVFLLTLAIVDDLGAIVVIAVFYTDHRRGRLVARRRGHRPVPS